MVGRQRWNSQSGTLMVDSQRGTVVVKKRWWNNNGGKVMVEQGCWNSNGGTASAEPRDKTVGVDQ